MDIPELLLRITTSFVSLFILTRIMGRKEISQMTFLNFASGITIGSIAADFIVNESTPIIHGVIALLVWTIFTLIIDLIDLKIRKARIITSGNPIIVIKDGNIIRKALTKSRLELDTLKTMLRQKNIFNISDVEYAIFEVNGQLSILPKETMQPVTKTDMNISNTKNNLYSITTEVVVEGKILSENLSKLNLDENWLEQQLKGSGINTVEDVFYAEVKNDGTLFINNENKG